MNFFSRHPMLVLAIGILGVSASAILVKYSQAPSVITAVYRLGWTVLLMLPMTFGNREHRAELASISGKLLALCAASGVFLAFHFVTWFESLNMTSVASSTTIVCTEVIWVALGYKFFLHGNISKSAVACIVITLMGSVIIAFSDYSSSGSDNILGDLVSLCAAILVAAYTLIGRVARKHASTTVYTFIVYVFCFATLLVSALVTGTPLWGYGQNELVIGLLLSVLSTLMGHSIFSWCLKYISPAFVSAAKLCEPVFAAVAAYFLFREAPVPLQVLGGAIIIGGVILYSRVEARESHKA